MGTFTLPSEIEVLVVDDNPINQTVFATFMKRNGVKYDVANNGAEAIEKWKTGKFHLILMDIEMPIMNGIDATKEIRRIELEGNTQSGSSSAYTPILALTAMSSEKGGVQALAAGCNDFIRKPVHLQVLADKIVQWVSGGGADTSLG